MATAAVEKGVDEEKDRVEGAVVFCFERAAYALVDERTVEGVGVVGRREADVEACGGRRMLNGGKDDAEVLQDGGADGTERTLGVAGAGGDEERFYLRGSMAASLMSLETPR